MFATTAGFDHCRDAVSNRAVNRGFANIGQLAFDGHLAFNGHRWLSAFGGRFVPIAFLASDVLSEYVRNEEMKSKLIEPGKRY